MAENKKSFIAYVDWKETFDVLPDEKAGQLVKHLFAYVNDENPETNDVLITAVFANIKHQLKRDLRKWEELSSQRAEIGRLGGIKSGEARQSKMKQMKQMLQSGSKTKQNEHDTVNVNDTVNDNDNEEIKEIISLFNTTRFPKVQKLSDSRKKHLQARIKEYGADKVKEIITKASKSDFLCGINNNGWKANFDWLVNPNNFVKVMEGNYENKPRMLA